MIWKLASGFDESDIGDNQLFAYSASYRVPCGRKTYCFGVVRQMTGEHSLSQAIRRNVKYHPLRKIGSELRAVLTPLSEMN